MIYITELSEFQKLLTNESRVVLVDFYADWCGPCRAIADFFQELSDKYSNIICCVKVNVDDANEITDMYSINAMPTFLAFYNGNQIAEITGAKKQELQNLVNQISFKM